MTFRILAISLWLVAYLSGAAQPSLPKPADSLARTELLNSILDKHTEAMGGSRAWSALESWQIRSKRANGVVWTTARKPDQFRIEFKLGDRHVVKSYDGEEGWVWRNGELEPMRPGEAIEMAEEPEFYGELVYARQSGFDIRYLGEEQLENRPCFLLEVHKHAQDVQAYWIDRETYLILQCGEHSEDPAHEGIYYTTRFEDYRKVNGLMFPFAESLWANGKLRASWKMEEVRVNPALDADYFSRKP